MNNAINLLPKTKETKTVHHSSRIKVVRALAMGSLFLVVIFSIVLFILVNFSPLPSLQEEEQERLTEFSRSRPKMAKIVLMNDRLGDISKILKKRTYYNLAIDQMQAELPVDARIDMLKIDKQAISVTVTSGSLLSLENFLENISKLTEQKKFIGQLTLSKLTANTQNAQYSLSLDMTLLPK